MNLILWIGNVFVSAVAAYLVDIALRKPVPQRWRYVAAIGVFLAVFFTIAYIASARVRDVTKALFFTNTTDRHCFFDTKITGPEGAELRVDAEGHDIPLDTQIAWEPNSCIMVVQAYQGNDLVEDLEKQESGEATVRHVTLGRTGETELKIFREGFETPSNSIWVNVIP
jgi:hypothetical protein